MGDRWGECLDVSAVFATLGAKRTPIEKLEKTKISKREIPAGRVRRGALAENILEFSWKGFSNSKKQVNVCFLARRRVEGLPSDGIFT